jgi:hypothetical protein
MPQANAWLMERCREEFEVLGQIWGKCCKEADQKIEMRCLDSRREPFDFDDFEPDIGLAWLFEEEG